jgi:hypothetical protein
MPDSIYNLWKMGFPITAHIYYLMLNWMIVVVVTKFIASALKHEHNLI